MISAKKINPALTQFVKEASSIITILKPGDLVEATLIKRERKSVFFDLGAVGAGVVFGVEFSNAKEILKTLKPGDKTTAKVVDPENDNGYVELSLAGASKQKVWQKMQEYKESGEIIAVKISGANSGGLISDLEGLKGFIPVSQLSSENYPKVDDGDRAKITEHLRSLIGKEMKAKVIDANSRANKLILSEREVMSEDIKELAAQYKVGDVVDGIISGVADFGAFFRFTENPKVEGLIHISELDHRLIENPKEVVKIDDSVKAKIIDIKDGRISLSLKALKPDPWVDADKKYKAGDAANGLVSRFNPFGAFVNLEDGLQGMIHVSEFGSVEEMKKQLEVGKEYQFKIDAVKPQEKRIVLKMKK